MQKEFPFKEQSCETALLKSEVYTPDIFQLSLQLSERNKPMITAMRRVNWKGKVK